MSRPPAIRPIVLRRFRAPFSDPDWIFEVQHDGFRALAYVVNGDCRLVSRKNHVYRSFDPVRESIAHALEGGTQSWAERRCSRSGGRHDDL